jgi:hypothetical protein
VECNNNQDMRSTHTHHRTYMRLSTLHVHHHLGIIVPLVSSIRASMSPLLRDRSASHRIGTHAHMHTDWTGLTTAHVRNRGSVRVDDQSTLLSLSPSLSFSGRTPQPPPRENKSREEEGKERGTIRVGDMQLGRGNAI